MLPRKDGITFGPSWPEGFALALALAASLAAAAEPALPVPKVLPARRADLPAGFTQPTPASMAELKTMERHVETLLRRVSPAVVAVEIDGSSGSGVVISTDGLVLTAGHVCGEANRPVRLTFPDGRSAYGKTLGAELDSDTGLLRITDRGTWPTAPVGDLTQVHVGDWVLALGHPGGFDLRRSLVVRLGRIIRAMPGAVQTDCTISPGDSGGPLFDMHGRVIGIHSAINPSLVGNFHVPINEFYDTWEDLVKVMAKPEPRVASAYLGAKGVDAAGGCRVEAVEENSPASQGGLKVGDVLLKVDGRDIKAAAVFGRWVEEAQPGELLNLEVKRGDKLVNLTVKVAPLPKHKATR